MILQTSKGHPNLSEEESKISNELGKLLSINHTAEEIVEEGSRFEQRRKKTTSDANRKSKLRRIVENERNREASIESSGYATSEFVGDQANVTRCTGEIEEDPRYDSNLDDVMTVFDSDEDNDLDLQGIGLFILSLSDFLEKLFSS